MNVGYRKLDTEQRDRIREAALKKLEEAADAYCHLRMDDLTVLIRETVPEADSIEFYLDHDETGWKPVLQTILDVDENPLYDGRFQVATATGGEDAINTSWSDGEAAIQEILGDIADRHVAFLGQEPGAETSIDLDLATA
jgi:hypothetical protein